MGVGGGREGRWVWKEGDRVGGCGGRVWREGERVGGCGWRERG